MCELSKLYGEIINLGNDIIWIKCRPNLTPVARVSNPQHPVSKSPKWARKGSGRWFRFIPCLDDMVQPLTIWINDLPSFCISSVPACSTAVVKWPRASFDCKSNCKIVSSSKNDRGSQFVSHSWISSIGFLEDKYYVSMMLAFQQIKSPFLVVIVKSGSSFEKRVIVSLCQFTLPDV